jgi:hypothetical protein
MNQIKIFRRQDLVCAVNDTRQRNGFFSFGVKKKDRNRRYKRNIDALSRNHCYHGEAISIYIMSMSP